MKALATALLVGLLPSFAAAQRPLVRLDGVSRGSVTVSLDRPGYLVVVAFDAKLPPLFSPERIGWIWNGSAIDVARGVGQSLAATGADESAWQAAWWRPR